MRVIHFCSYVIEPKVVIERRDLNFHHFDKDNYFLTALKQIHGEVDMGRQLTHGRIRVSLPYSPQEADSRFFSPLIVTMSIPGRRVKPL